MKVRRALAVAILCLLSVLALGPMALAVEDRTIITATEEQQEPPATGEQEPSGAFIDAPAEDDGGINPAWTYRFLIPTAIVLTALIIAVTVIMYFVRVVRTRYTIVE